MLLPFTSFHNFKILQGRHSNTFEDSGDGSPSCLAASPAASVHPSTAPTRRRHDEALEESRAAEEKLKVERGEEEPWRPLESDWSPLFARGPCETRPDDILIFFFPVA